MDLENAFKSVLDSDIFSESAIFILFDQFRKATIVKELGEIPAQLGSARRGIGVEQIHDAAISAGCCFTMIPLSGLAERAYVGSVFLAADVSEDVMRERLIELRGIMKSAIGRIEQVKQYRLLYQVTKKFHSSMDVGGVLREIIHALSELYPSFDCRLLLSHDSENETDLPVEYLEYGTNNGNDPASKAYLTGDIHVDEQNGKRKVLYVPLRGKQGVYGVMRVTVPEVPDIANPDIELIELLADTGGNALENARLYQQSQRFISDLQLINKTSHTLNSNLRLSDTINFMTVQITSSFKAEEVGFILFHPYNKIEVLAGSTTYFWQEESQPFIRFACQRLKMDRDPLFIGDLESEQLGVRAPYRSFICIPMIQKNELQGVVMVLHRRPYHFSFDEFKLLQSLIHHSTLAFSNSILHEQLQKMVITDYLTGLHARHYLDDQIQQSMNRDRLGCFILLDIDDFKVINDTYGHQVGDEVLIQVAEIIQRNIRKVDVAARWGGEELAIYLPRIGRNLGTEIAKRLVNKVSEGTSPKTTVSCGISCWDGKNGDDSVSGLFSRADRALYAAKGSGKNQVVYEELSAKGAIP